MGNLSFLYRHTVGTLRRRAAPVAGALLGIAAAASAQVIPPVKGTEPLPGTVGEVGVTYTLGHGNSAVNLTLLKLSYNASHFLFLNKLVAPDADHKYLILEYQLKNPNAGHDLYVSGSTIHWTAVDAHNTNHDAGTVENVDDRQTLAMNLKPGQPIRARACILLPAQGPAPKLILSWGGPDVRRFDLHGKVAPVDPLIADPADPSGASALSTVPAKFRVAYPDQLLDIGVESVTIGHSPIQNIAPAGAYVIVTVSAHNPGPTDQPFDNNSFDARIVTADGDLLMARFRRLNTQNDQANNGVVLAGGNKQMRYVYTLSNPALLQKMTIHRTGGSRNFVYDLNIK